MIGFRKDKLTDTHRQTNSKMTHLNDLTVSSMMYGHCKQQSNIKAVHDWKSENQFNTDLQSNEGLNRNRMSDLLILWESIWNLPHGESRWGNQEIWGQYSWAAVFISGSNYHLVEDVGTASHLSDRLLEPREAVLTMALWADGRGLQRRTGNRLTWRTSNRSDAKWTRTLIGIPSV